MQPKREVEGLMTLRYQYINTNDRWNIAPRSSIKFLIPGATFFFQIFFPNVLQLCAVLYCLTVLENELFHLNFSQVDLWTSFYVLHHRHACSLQAEGETPIQTKDTGLL